MENWKSIEEERYRVLEVNHPFFSTQYWVFDRKFWSVKAIGTSRGQAEFRAAKLNKDPDGSNLQHCETCRCGRATMDPLTHGV